MVPLRLPFQCRAGNDFPVVSRKLGIGKEKRAEAELSVLGSLK